MVVAGTKSADVLVVGGGPAGLAAAIALRMRGAEVTVADSMEPPIEKTCGEGLMPDSIRDLESLGVAIRTEEGAAFRGIRFVNHATDGSGQVVSSACAQFPSAFQNADGRLGTGVGMRRAVLHRRLVERAREVGVRLRWKSTVQLKENGRVLVAGEPCPYGWLVGADGQNSRVRRWAGLEDGAGMECAILTRRFGFRQHFQVEPWSPYVEVHWARSGQAYVTPVGSTEVCVATISRDKHSRLSTILGELPWLRERLGGGSPGGPRPVDVERGALTTTRRLAQVAKGRVALLGDASGSADAITGEGMGMGFRQALLLAECLDGGDLKRYNRLHPSILQLPQAMARVMLLMDRSARLRRRAIGMLASQPEIFARMLGVHLGTESMVRFVATRGLDVAWRLAFPGKADAIVDAPFAG